MPTSFAAPARTGRPVGARPQAGPATIAAFVADALTSPLPPPPPEAKPPRTPGRKAGIWDTMNTQERSAYAKSLAAKRDPKNMARPQHSKRGPRNGWTAAAADVARAAARLKAEKLVAALQAAGTIAQDDAEGAAATVEALTIVASPGNKAIRVRYARKLLRHYAPEDAALLL